MVKTYTNLDLFAYIREQSSSIIVLPKHNPKKEMVMSKPVNAPSTTGNPSGGGRGNNPPRK